MKWHLFSLFILLSLISCKKDYSHLQTKVIGHAGESLLDNKSEFPPNTIESVKRALELGADGVEIDVQMTNDGVLVAWHDETLDGNSSGSGCVSELSLLQTISTYVYNTDIKIALVSDISEYVIGQNKSLMLDVKNYDVCSDSYIDYNQFNIQLNQLLDNYSPQQKELITVNSTSVSLLYALTDTVIKKSIESDEPTTAIQDATDFGFHMLTVKLNKLDKSHLSLITENNLQLTIMNVKTRSDVKKALEYAPDFVISDNIPCTTKALNGK